MGKPTTMGSIYSIQWCGLSGSWKTSANPLNAAEQRQDAAQSELLTLLCKGSPAALRRNLIGLLVSVMTTFKALIAEGWNEDPPVTQELYYRITRICGFVTLLISHIHFGYWCYLSQCYLFRYKWLSNKDGFSSRTKHLILLTLYLVYLYSKTDLN